MTLEVMASPIPWSLTGDAVSKEGKGAEYVSQPLTESIYAKSEKH